MGSNSGRFVRIGFFLVVSFSMVYLWIQQNRNAASRVFQPVNVNANRDDSTVHLKDEAINESSGLALSQKYPNCFWTHNDSGDTSRLFLIGQDGETRIRLYVTGARAIDWEDMSIGQIHGKSMLVVGDIGGNAKQRDDLVLYFVSEPEMDLEKQGKTVDVHSKPHLILHVRVPGGVTNYEAIAFDPNSNFVMLIEKTAFGARVYSIAIPENDTEETYESKVVAELIGRSNLPVVTACDISKDGFKLIALNYQVAFLFERELRNEIRQSWSDVLSSEPRIVTIPQLPQAEAVCFSNDGESIFVTSEHLPTKIIKLKLDDQTVVK